MFAEPSLSPIGNYNANCTLHEGVYVQYAHVYMKYILGSHRICV